MYRARHLAVAPGLFIAQLFRLIFATVILSVTIAGALNARALCPSMFLIVGTIAIAIDVPTLLIGVVVRAALGVM